MERFGKMSGMLPFSISCMEQGEIPIRDRILDAAGPGIDGFRLNALSDLLDVEQARLHLEGLLFSPAPPRVSWIPVALTRTSDVCSEKAVLGLPPILAAALMDAALGRPFGWTREVMRVDALSQGEIGALLYALSLAGKDWTDAGGADLVVRGLLEDTDQIADFFGRMPKVEIGALLYTDAVRHPLRLWCGAPERGGGRVERRIGRTARHWNVRIGLCVGCSSLVLDEISGLALGDKIVLDAWNHPMGRGGPRIPLLLNGKWHRYGRLTREGEIHIAKATEQEATMKAKPSETSALNWPLADSDADDAKKMTVTVRVEAGCLNMPVEQALGLVPGRVIRLDRPVGPEVDIFVGGKLFGRGELVDVDGFMAVEIKELRLAPGTSEGQTPADR